MEEFIRLSHIAASDNSSHRLQDFNMTIFSGEFVLLAGLHGSGKHLVSQILTGNLIADAGDFYIDGIRCQATDPRFFSEKGIYSLENSSCLIETMSIYENIFLLNRKNHHGLLFPRKGAVLETGFLLKQLGVHRSPFEQVAKLSPFEKLLVSLARILSCPPRLLILNPGRYNLSTEEFRKLSDILLSQKRKGVSCLFISNHSGPFSALSDTAVIVENGRDKRTLRFQPLTHKVVSSYMEADDHDAPLQSFIPPTSRVTEVFLSNKTDLSPIRPVWIQGEITGIFDTLPDSILSLELFLPQFCEKNGLVLSRRRYQDFQALGPKNIHFIPENIENQLFETMSVAENLLLPRYSRLCGFLGQTNDAIAHYCVEEFARWLGRKDTPFSIHELNRLEKRLLGIYRFSTSDTEALFLDSPFINLDSEECTTMELLLRKISNTGTAVFITSKQLAILKKYCSRIIVCNQFLIKEIQEDT